jgi:dipeptidyl aminopeptidase/acylaminoacyl peptidase
MIQKIAASPWFRRSLILHLGAALLSSVVLGAYPPRNPFTVRDSIAMTKILEMNTPDGEQAAALFSPDRSHVVILTRHGDLQRDVNVDTLLLFDAGQIQPYLSSPDGKAAPRPKKLFTVDARQPWDEIAHLTWHDNQELCFTAKSDSNFVQAYCLNITTGKVSQLTNSSVDVDSFAIGPDQVVYFTLASTMDSGPRDVDWRSFSELIEPDGAAAHGSPLVELFTKSMNGNQTRQIDMPVSRLSRMFQQIWISPTGDYAISYRPTASWPSNWAEYKIPHYELFGYSADKMGGDPTSPEVQNRTQYQLIDLRHGTARALINAPSGFLEQNGTPPVVFWTSDGNSVIVSNTFLPLDSPNEEINHQRELGPAIAEVDLHSGKITEITPEPYPMPETERGTTAMEPITSIDWDPKENVLTVRKRKGPSQAFRKVDGAWKPEPAHDPKNASPEEFVVSRDEGLNERPKLYAAGGTCKCRKVLYDPNPQFDGFEFGHAELFDWTDTNGIKWQGGVTYPTSYVKGKKYPLVVQTHGFNANEFLIDGPDGYTTAFAAQPLANAGFVILQIADNRRAMTLDEREGPLYAEGFHAGIEKLVSDGLVDPSKVGLIAFSRTGWHTLHFLKQYPDFLAAVTLADAGLIGYVADIISVNSPKDFKLQFAKVVGGIQNPADWMSKSTMYKLSGIQTPVRLEANDPGSAIATWEMYSLLRSANRKVDFLYFPRGNHILFSPRNRLGSQGGNVDWFRFWLQGYEDPDPKKAAQYVRWRTLKK